LSPRAQSAHKPDLRVYRIASLILANAMLFQEVIAQSESNVRTIRLTLESKNLSDEFSTQWNYIQEHVDFIPIFSIAREILLRLPSSPETEGALRELANTSIRLLANRAALRHDLMGRIFHRLLADAKFFGAFYTKIPAATVLLKLAVEEFDTNIDWHDPQSVGKIVVGDLACGTGTLLKAALAAMEDRHIAASARIGKLPRCDELHKTLIENGLWGFDVLSSAVHLAAAAIAMHDPHVSVDDMHFYTVPLGGRSRLVQLGSIEFAKGRKLHVQRRLIGASIGVKSSTQETEEPNVLSLPPLDMCTMNPPFTRSVYGNLLFGGVGEKERAELQSKLQEVVRDKDLNANITAGLGSVFFAIALRVTKDNGMLAFVLPRTVLNGEAWGPTRELIHGLDLRYVIASHEFNNWNFSESTQLSEVLLVMRKKHGGASGRDTVFVNVWRQPRTATEALTLARAIKTGTPARLENAIGTCELCTNGQKYGEMVTLDLTENAEAPWSIPVSFAQTDLCRAAYYLSSGRIFLPRLGQVGTVRLIDLNVIAELGPDGRDVYDGFSLADSPTPYPAFWGYDSETVLRLSQNTNQHLAPLTHALPGRNLRDAQLLWSRAGTLMLPKELWLTTCRLTGVVLPERALSNVWWPTRWRSGNDNEQRAMERRLALWFNSTLGFFTLIMQRQETRGAWCKFPKAWYEELPTLDLRQLSDEKLRALDELWKSVSDKQFLPIPQIVTDPVRAQIDNVFSKVLEIPSLEEMRGILGKEPLIRGEKGDS
jgi:hypothetical protein